MVDPMDRLRQAIKLGPSALLRLKAEVILKRMDDPNDVYHTHPAIVSATEQDREELLRIAASPKDDDREREFLARFDIFDRDENTIR